MKRLSDKLDDKWLGPFMIKQVIGYNTRCLELPETMRIHPVFYVLLLEPYNGQESERLTQEPPRPIEINGEEEWEVEVILDSRLQKLGRRKRETLQYLVKWSGFPRVEATWQLAEDVANARDVVEDFHAQYPRKLGPRH